MCEGRSSQARTARTRRRDKLLKKEGKYILRYLVGPDSLICAS